MVSHWNITPHAVMISCTVTLYWQWVNQILCYTTLYMSSKGTSTTNFKSYNKTLTSGTLYWFRRTLRTVRLFTSMLIVTNLTTAGFLRYTYRSQKWWFIHDINFHKGLFVTSANTCIESYCCSEYSKNNSLTLSPCRPL